ncbi:MAG TPA: uroporphyrinogen decarboxylase [Bacilli bacterium]|nr:uroporphyrinogen decarboxylase [Bacilli bacterium]
MTYNDTFLRSIRKEKIDHVPVWYMRQAGRYQASYRKIKEKYSLMQICEMPELCAEVTLSPVRDHGVDAAILYSDIMVPIRPMGIDVDIKAGVGPVIDNPIRSMADVEAMRALEPEADLPATIETIKILRKELEVPLIGFAGAPFTLASYLVEGRPTRDYHKVKAMMYSAPDVWYALMDKLADMVVTYMKSQVAAGAQAIQIFDSWIGCLSPYDYERYVFPTMKKIFNGLREVDAPKIYFGVNTGHLLHLWKELPVDVIGVDWRMPLDVARERVGSQFALQGNLDPVYLLAPFDVLKEEVKRIIDLGLQQSRTGYVFNFGHGFFPEAPEDVVRPLTDFIHEYSAEKLKHV